MVVCILTDKETKFRPRCSSTAAKPFFMTNKRLVTKLHSIGPATSKLFLFCEFISGSPEKAHFTL